MPIFCFYHTATIIFYLPILGNQNLHPAYFIFRLEHFFPFCHFCSNPLASRWLPVGASLPIFTLLLQPAYFSISSGWGISSHCANFPPTRLPLDVFRLELSFPFRHFCSNPLASRCLPVGAFLPISSLLLQPACFSMLSNWSIPSHFPSLLQHACFSMLSNWSIPSHYANFPPTRLLLDGFRLEHSFPFRHFCSNPLASRYLPVGAFLPISSLLLQPACFSMLSNWSIPSHCANFPQPACKLACSDACAWLVAPDNPAGFRLHITGTSSPLRSDSVSVIPQIHAFACKLACSDACAWGIITQKSPRAMWSSAGLLEKGVDYKFHVREFMFRCS